MAVSEKKEEKNQSAGIGSLSAARAGPLIWAETPGLRTACVIRNAEARPSWTARWAQAGLRRLLTWALLLPCTLAAAQLGRTIARSILPPVDPPQTSIQLFAHELGSDEPEDSSAAPGDSGNPPARRVNDFPPPPQSPAAAEGRLLRQSQEGAGAADGANGAANKSAEASTPNGPEHGRGLADGRGKNSGPNRSFQTQRLGAGSENVSAGEPRFPETASGRTDSLAEGGRIPGGSRALPARAGGGEGRSALPGGPVNAARSEAAGRLSRFPGASLLAGLAGAGSAGARSGLRGSRGPRSPTFGRLYNMDAQMRPTARMDSPEQAGDLQTAQWSGGRVHGFPPGGGFGTSGPYGGRGYRNGGGRSEESSGSEPAYSAPPITETANATPHQDLIDLAEKLLLAAGLLMLAMTFIKMFSKPGDPSYALWQGVLKALAAVVVTMSATVAAIGVMLMTDGQTPQGLMFTASSVLMGVMAAKELWPEDDPDTANPPETLKEAAQHDKDLALGEKPANPAEERYETDVPRTDVPQTSPPSDSSTPPIQEMEQPAQGEVDLRQNPKYSTRDVVCGSLPKTPADAGETLALDRTKMEADLANFNQTKTAEPLPSGLQPETGNLSYCKAGSQVTGPASTEAGTEVADAPVGSKGAVRLSATDIPSEYRESVGIDHIHPVPRPLSPGDVDEMLSNPKVKYISDVDISGNGTLASRTGITPVTIKGEVATEMTNNYKAAVEAGEGWTPGTHTDQEYFADDLKNKYYTNVLKDTAQRYNLNLWNYQLGDSVARPAI